MDARRYVRHDRRGRLTARLSVRRPLAAGSRQGKKNSSAWHRRRWGRPAAGLCAGLGLAWACAAGLFPLLRGWVDRPVARVEVQAPFFHISQQELQSLLLPRVQTRFFSLDMKAIAASLERDGRVSRALVRRVWPASVSVQIQEEVPVARWQDSQLLNARGEVLDFRHRGHEAGLPSLYGPVHRASDVMQHYLSLGKTLRPLGLTLARVSLTGTGSWSFRIGDVSVSLGSEQLVRRLQRFVRLYDDSLKDVWPRVQNVDLRYRDGVAVRWRKAGDLAVRTSDTEKEQALMASRGSASHGALHAAGRQVGEQ